MKSILETCKPREDILTGSFNPEIFTANLSEVIRYYQDDSVNFESIYTDARQFFDVATYPTASLRQLLGDVFGRLSGDNSRPALHRLETAFGGGKTHALIACTHVAYRGTEIAPVMGGIMDADLLPEPGEVAVVGVQGDEIPVHEPKGKALVPYTLWGELAYQIGGDALYQQVEDVATSYAAPGRPYLDAVVGSRDQKVLILLDELAQYAARLEAARPDGGEQLAAFLFSLHGYARTHPGIGVVVTLAGRMDAFASQTKQLSTLLSEVTGEDVDEETALSVGQKAVDQVTSVAFRDTAPGLVPVRAAELSKVLAQRLLQDVDRGESEVAAEEYAAMYERNARLLPDVAVRADYEDRMAANYPFHPTLIDFLNNRLSTAENFQGTRGVLRVLAYAMRSIWRNQVDAPMIHGCHLDLRNPAIANELLGRTGSSDFLPVLNADIGGPDTEQLESSRSNAEEADLQNPHPQGYPMYEYAWKTVFLHSLVGREQGLSSPVFGVTEPQALFAASLPELTPPQVKKALDKIEDLEGGAFYLRHRDGRYYASVEPSTRRALSRIWHSLKSQEERIQETLNATARKVVSADVGTFHVEHDVYAPEHIPDGQERPVLGLVAVDAGEIDVESFITTRGPHHPRERQNLVFLLVPETVRVTQETRATSMFSDTDEKAEKALNRLQDNARWAVAIRELRKRPQDYGINPARLDRNDFRQRATEREKALETSMTEAYNSLWFPSASGTIQQKMIKTAGGEGGASVVQRIRKVLLDDNELITGEHTDQATLTNFQQLFFQRSETPALEDLRSNFLCRRDWPTLTSIEIFDKIIRAGVKKGKWCLFRMLSDESTRPDEFYDRDTDLHLSLDLRQAGYCIIRPQDAKKRHWTETDKPDPHKIKDWVKKDIGKYDAVSVADLKTGVRQAHGDVDDQDLSEALGDLIRGERVLAYQGREDQQEKPQLYHGAAAALYTPGEDDVVVTKSEAAKRGWLVDEPESLTLSSREGAEILVPLLGRIGSLYNRGASSAIEELDLTELELPEGGTLRLSLHNAPPESLRLLGELLEVLDGVAEMGPQTRGYLEIKEPPEDCPFVKELKRIKEEGE